MYINLSEIKSNRQCEFAKMYYKWVCDCLTKDEMWEELALFKLGVNTAVRQMELLTITYSQIEFPIIKKIPILKRYKNQTTQYYHNDIIISDDTFDTINRIWNNQLDPNEKIFKHNMNYYVKRIAESIGDSRFNGMVMRSIGVCLLVNRCKTIIKE